MKADINEFGVLTVTAETPLEGYALKHWLIGWDLAIGEQQSILCIRPEPEGVDVQVTDRGQQ